MHNIIPLYNGGTVGIKYDLLYRLKGEMQKTNIKGLPGSTLFLPTRIPAGTNTVPPYNALV